MKVFIALLILLMNLPFVAAQWKPGDILTDTRDGQKYKTVVIGNQVWMAENLNYGTMIPTTKTGYEMSDNNITEKYCWDNDTANCCGTSGKMKRGGFYEWREAMQYWQGQPQKPVQGICPKGWHLPSNDEWNTLFNSQGGANCYVNLVDGGASGFDALMTGYRCTMTGSFRPSAMSADTRTYFWSCDQTDSENAHIIELGLGSIQTFSFSKSVGLCIRCIMDDVPSEVEENSSEGFELIPNPATDIIEVQVKSSGMLVTIYSRIGEKLIETDNSKIDITGLSAGIYYIRIGENIQKFVKL